MARSSDAGMFPMFHELAVDLWVSRFSLADCARLELGEGREGGGAPRAGIARSAPRAAEASREARDMPSMASSGGRRPHRLKPHTEK